MANCEYSLDGTEWVELPVGPRFDPVLSLVDTDAECETDGGARYVYRQSRRDRWQLRFRVTTEQLEAFRELHLLVDGMVRPFYLRLGGDEFQTIAIYGRKEAGIFPYGISIPSAHVVYDYDIVISGEIPAIEVLSMSDFYTKTEAEARFVDEDELAAALASYYTQTATDSAIEDALDAYVIPDGSVTAAKVAANAITTTKLLDDAVTSLKIAANAVTTAKIAASAITATELAANAVTTAKLIDDAVSAVKIATSAITTIKLADSAITTIKIADGQITTPKLVADVITANEIAANAVTTAKLNALAVTAAKIAANTITAAQIAAGTITATEIAANTITAAKIAALTITGAEIAAGTIVAGKLAADSVAAANIIAGTITADKLSVSDLSAISANLGSITAGTIDAVDITGGSITGTTIDTAGAGNHRVHISTADGIVVIDDTDTNRVILNASIYAGIQVNGLRSIDTNDIFMEAQDQSVQLFVSQASARVSFAINGATRGYFDDDDGSGGGNQPTSLVVRVNGVLQRVNRAGSGGFLYI